MLLDRNAMLAQLGGDQSLFSEAIDAFLEDCPVRLRQIQAALNLGDGPAIRSSAHALRGAAGILTAHDLFDAARVIEDFGDLGQIQDARAAWPRLVDAAQAVMRALTQFAEDA